MPTTLITGANRGIGLEFARQYAAAGWRVLAACRNPERASELQALARAHRGTVVVHPLEVGDFAAIDALAGALRGERIDVLVNNAGIGWPPKPPHDDFGKTNYREWTDVMHVNVLAPMKMCEAFIEHVAASDRRTIAMISSRLGSVALANGDMKDHVYRSSKSALNMVTRLLADYLEARKIIPLSLGPGWVRTDMGGSSAALSVEESVSGMRQVIAKATIADAGGFFTYQGDKLPW